MKVAIGLGNPEPTYRNTRHNAGKMFVDRLAREFLCSQFETNTRIEASVCKAGNYVFAKPLTYMNESGRPARALIDFYKIETSQVYAIHDDLDLELGQYKIQFGKGPEGHNGLLSFYQHLGTKNIWHVRIGVDGREGDRSMSPSGYVLQQFTPAELNIFDSMSNELVKELSSHLKMNHSSQPLS